MKKVKLLKALLITTLLITIGWVVSDFIAYDLYDFTESSHTIINRVTNKTIVLPLETFNGKKNYPHNPSFIKFSCIMRQMSEEDNFTIDRYIELVSK